MTELVVISGKGGTGKTSVVGSLAALAQSPVLVDCDVDAADLHLIVNNTVRERNEFIGGKQARIIEQDCTGCGECVEYCRFDAIKTESVPNTNGDRYWIDNHACDGCGVCVRHCPEEAITFNDVVSGEWFISRTPYGPFVHARLGLAQANSGKLVTILRQQARALAETHDCDLIIVDGPPGIGCPVIATVTGASFILIVTEPSVSAMHDMKRLLELTGHFNIPTGICINKADINTALTNEIEEFAQANSTKVLGRIPFDPAVTAAQIGDRTVVETNDSSASASIRQLWSRIEHELAAWTV
jgi:MinD superfamily P-loop ATPase